MRTVALLCSLTLVSASLVATPAVAAPEAREMQAREAFAAGRYQDALDLYAKLYAEKLHPIFLRNVGRCYQNLGEPDKAISSFREYLRKAKAMSPEERAEVNGYIAEMEELKKHNQPAPPPTVEKKAPEAVPPPPVPAEALHPSSASTESQPSVNLTARREETPSREESSPVYTRWWFWTIVGTVVVAGGVGGAAAAGLFTKRTDAICGMDRTSCL